MPDYKVDKHGDVLLIDPFGNEVKVRPEAVSMWLEKDYTVGDPEKKAPALPQLPKVEKKTGEV